MERAYRNFINYENKNRRMFIMEISTDLTAIKSSKCFGIAWDGECKECNMCEVSNLCKQRTLGGAKPVISRPATTTKEENAEETVSTMKPATSRPEPKNASEQASTEVSESPKAKPKKDKEEVKYSDDMPEFKPMSVEEVLTLAKERGINPSDFDKYTNTNIKKMRIVMALKKTYIVK